MNTFEAIVREYANAADCTWEQAAYDIWETELGVQIAADCGYTMEELSEMADAEQYVRTHPWCVTAVYATHGLLPEEIQGPRICLRFGSQREAVEVARRWNRENDDPMTSYVVAKEVS